jgi:hypothetical protein
MIFVTPAKAGVHNTLKRLDSGFRRNDAEGLLQEPYHIKQIIKALFHNYRIYLQ